MSTISTKSWHCAAFTRDLNGRYTTYIDGKKEIVYTTYATREQVTTPDGYMYPIINGTDLIFGASVRPGANSTQ